MGSKTEKYIKDWFIDLNTKEIPPSYYVIRKSLLEAVNELKPILKGRVLDLACGVMPYKQFLMNDNITEYIGVDLEQSEYHNEVQPDLYWNGINIPLDDSSVDFILATEFLEHYFDTAKILLEIKRVLKPGGVLFFTVPNVWPLHEVPYDYHRFTPYALEKHFEQLGCSSFIIKSLGGLNYNIALSTALWYDNWLPKKYKKIMKPFLIFFIKFFITRDNKIEFFKNGQMYSGLYGFLTK
jgi:SAM-dependent methyltransferase